MQIHVRVNTGTTGTRFILTPRLLEYGTYKISMNASMYQTDGYNMSSATLIDGTTSSVNGYFEINACQIEAKIYGGNGKAVSSKGNCS